MKTKIIAGLIGLLGLFCPSTAMSQDLKQFTLEDLNFGGTNYHNMIAKNRWVTWWGEQLVRTDVEECYLVNKQTGKETRLFTLDELKKKSGLDLHNLYSVRFPEAGKTVVLLSDGNTRALVNWKSGKTLWYIDIHEARNAQASAYSKTSRATAYVKDDQLYVLTADGKSTQLTTDGSRDIVYGQSVHRDEFGINGGLFWSNRGEKLAFYRMDQSMVTDFPLVDIPEVDWTPKEGQSRIATPAPEKYPMAGDRKSVV